MPSAPKAPSSAASAKAPDVKIGDVVLDRYRVIEQIGSGGHSVVFKGTDERLSRPVCIKVFSGLGAAVSLLLALPSFLELARIGLWLLRRKPPVI